MGYTAIDILEKFIEIEKNGRDMYEDIGNMSKDIKIKMIAKVLKKEEERHILFYESLKEELKNVTEEVDFDIYDKVSFLLNKFKHKLDSPNTENTYQLLEFALEFEKQNVAVLVDIQGRLVRKKEDMKSQAYQVVSRVIEEEKKHVENLQRFVKK
ncbi:hypothetical protein [Inediibacterium massiliense]|uniref:hypothetical protein n=1 Tax=Inediibacterium massiliense TaxID=1658111 RepID=UPI0006B3FF4E|nr:hypothetical protein [Inediibacterium massiliense]